jgi:triacylglycerol lipase
MSNKDYTYALLASLSYDKSDDIRIGCEHLGYTKFDFFGCEHPAPAGFIAENDTDTVVCFRGTDNIRDIIFDLAIEPTCLTNMGHVHAGFFHDLNEFWPLLKSILSEKNKPLTFIGHSLGGALATLAVADCLLNTIPVTYLCTFGSPKVGDAVFADRFDALFHTHNRYWNGMDIVPAFPPSFLGWKHVGQLIHIGSKKIVLPSIDAHHIINYIAELNT